MFADGEWIASDLDLDEVERRMVAGELVAADRKGRRVVVNPAHVVYAEDWDRPAPRDAG